MADALNTVKIPCRGGLDTNLDIVQQGDNKPGSAIRLINYETSLAGGYRRLSGYQYLDADYPGPAGTGSILGVCVFNSLGIIAARKPSSGSNYIYKYTAGSGWSAINTHTPTFTDVTRVRFIKYNWVGDRVATLDGVNPLQIWDGTTWTNVTTTDAPTAPKYGTEHKNRLFVSSGNSILKFSAALNATEWRSAHGGGEINVGFPIVSLKAFRDALFIFGRNSIKKLEGSSSTDFVVSPVTVNLGCIAPDSVIEIAGDLYFLGPDGIRPIAATDRVGDVELESVSKPIQSLLATLPQQFDLDKICAVVVRSKSQFRYFFEDTTNSSGATGDDARGLIGCLRLNESGIGWEFGQLLGVSASCADSDYIGATEYVLHGNNAGHVMRQESGNSFNGEDVFSLYQTPWLDFEDTPKRKAIHKVWTFIRGQGNLNLKMSAVYDWENPEILSPANYSLDFNNIAALYETAEYDMSAIYDGTSLPVIRTNVEGSGYSVSLVYVTLDTNVPHDIQGYAIEFMMGDRR